MVHKIDSEIYFDQIESCILDNHFSVSKKAFKKLHDPLVIHLKQDKKAYESYMERIIKFIEEISKKPQTQIQCPHCEQALFEAFPGWYNRLRVRSPTLSFDLICLKCGAVFENNRNSGSEILVEKESFTYVNQNKKRKSWKIKPKFKNSLKHSKKYFDRVLVETKSSDIYSHYDDFFITKECCDKNSVFQEFTKNKSKQLFHKFLAIFKDWSEFHFDINFPITMIDPLFEKYLFLNYFFLHLLRERKGDIEEILSAGVKEFHSFLSPDIEVISGGLQLEINSNILWLFPALEWYYSEKTKEKYSKRLIDIMHKYDLKIREIGLESCFRTPRKFWILHP